MQSLIRTMALAATLAIGSPAMAAISVDSLNYPVWVERGGQLLPLAPGDGLETGDLINTGNSGRVWLAVEDGSVIKLGQGSRFAINMAGFRDTQERSIFDAAFDLLGGAFRFTSGFFAARTPATHEVGFRVGAVTAGVRGTDIWGRSGDDEDFVALLEGSIEVSSEGDSLRMMNQPLTLYRKASGRQADGVKPVDAAVVQELAGQTELAFEAGIFRIDGAYDLVLASVPSEQFDSASLDRFRRAGYPAVVIPARVDGRDYSRIVLRGLTNPGAAVYLRRQIADRFAIEDAWITRRD